MLLICSIIPIIQYEEELQKMASAQCNLHYASYWPCACQEVPQQKPENVAKDTVCVQRDFS